MHKPEQFEDQPRLEELAAQLVRVGFKPPKWTYRYNVPISELAPCSSRRLLCDIVAYRDGQAVVVFELDGSHHNTERQKQYDEAKRQLLVRHGIRLWRMWNSELRVISGEAAAIFRRDLKASMYANTGTLKSDYTKACRKCALNRSET